MVGLLLPSLLALGALAPSSITLSWGNDLLNVGPLFDGGWKYRDDAGFTNDMALHIELGDTSLDFRHRMITERRGSRRTDEVTGGARMRWDWTRGLVFHRLRAGFDLVLTGDFGGAAMQAAIHRLVRNPAPPQTLYVGGRAVGTRFAGEAQSGIRTRHFALAAGARGEVAVGAALSRIEIFARTVAETKLWQVLTLGASLELGVEHFFGNERSLTFPGAYVTGSFHPSPRIGLWVGLWSWVAGFRLLVNEGGAGTNVGVLEFGWRATEFAVF